MGADRAERNWLVKSFGPVHGIHLGASIRRIPALKVREPVSNRKKGGTAFMTSFYEDVFYFGGEGNYEFI